MKPSCVFWDEPLNTRSKIWLAAVAALLLLLIGAAVCLPHSYALAAIGDLTYTLLLASGAASFIPLALRSRGRVRLFWALIIFGLTLWFSYQLAWTWYEVTLHRDLPDLFAGDVVLFLDIVPLMAALALRPHAPADEYAARLGKLDFALLLVWWLYLYVLIVIPWQYVEPNVSAYNHNLDNVYLIEKLAFLVGLVTSWITSKGSWRKLYAHLFGMMVAYIASSTVANWAITHQVYYSGSLYDVPLAFAIAWLTWIGLHARTEQPDEDARPISTVYSVWVARCGMIAVFSLPIFAAWALADTEIPPHIRAFRIVLTLAASFVMSTLIFLRQQLLDRELIQLLNQSRESFDHLTRLQAQILQSEKLASVGQLVGGAAHELNNPITAMLGYSDLLLSTTLTSEQLSLAARIGQHVRRTKSLVASLISFARQTPAAKSPLDLNTLARTAVKLSQPQWEALKIEVRMQCDLELPKVLGDPNQLLQVCLQLIGSCLHLMSENGGKVLVVSTFRQDVASVIEIVTPPSPLPRSDSDSSGVEDSLGLSACRGILQEHRGHISLLRDGDGSTQLRVELPAADVTAAASARSRQATVPVLWQSRPFA